MPRRTLVPLVSLLVALPLSAPAQDAPVTRLGPPTGTHPAEFTRVQGVRELVDGRVYLVDAHEFRVVRVDFASGDVVPMGRTGQGPGEYQMPLDLVALPADSAVVIEMTGGPANVLLTREGVSPDGIRVEGPASGRTAFMIRSETDARGRVYFYQRLLKTVDGKPVATDSNAVVRVDRASGGRDTVAYVSGRARSPLIKADREEQVIGGMVVSRPFNSPIPFLSVDQTAVAPDGRVAVISVEPYHVTFFGANGERTVGPRIAFEPVRVDDDVKEAYREDAKRPKLSLLITRGGGSTPRVGPSRYTEPENWPDVLPAFVGDAAAFASDGNLWVQRATHPDSPPTFDVIDRAGRVTSRVELPEGRRLVGFGDGTVYLVRTDDVGLEYVERYALPD